MQVMLDTCVWGGALTDLRAAGHDVVWAGEWDQEPGRLRIRPADAPDDGEPSDREE